MNAFNPRFTISHAIATGLTTIERMSERALLLEAHHTTHIEGTELTMAQAERA